MGKIVLDPITRIEGHLRIDTNVEGGRVVDAWSRGEMFRGFESLLAGRDPLDAPVIVERICGVCPVSHAITSCKAIESAFGVRPPLNGLLLRNLILGANYLQSHVLHFYQLSALDFVDVESLLAYGGSDPVLLDLKRWAKAELASNRILPAAPFLPRLPGDYPKDSRWNTGALAHYAEALEIRLEAHRMAALFGGKMPHPSAIVPGGVTTGVDAEAVEDFRTRLRRVRRFIENAYIPDLAGAARLFPGYAANGRGVMRYLCFGAFDEGTAPWLPSGTVEEGRLGAVDLSKLTEEVGSSRYAPAAPVHPRQGETRPDARKSGGYSWLKAPRYGGKSFEVGPLARMLVAWQAGTEGVRPTLQSVLKEAGLKEGNVYSTLGRHAARGVEALLLSQRMERWLDRLVPEEASVTAFKPGASGQGEGLVEAPRGALGHWIQVQGGRIARYQCVVPSTWNFSPRGDRGDLGPVEAALMGTAVDPARQGLEVARIVRSFDPCIACAVH